MGSMFIYISLHILWKPAIKTIIIIIIIICGKTLFQFRGLHFTIDIPDSNVRNRNLVFMNSFHT